MGIFLDIHYGITIIIVILGFLTQARLLFNYIKHRTVSDLYQFHGLFFIGSFSWMEFIVNSNNFLSTTFPDIFNVFTDLTIRILFVVSIGSGLLGISIQILLISWVLRTTEIKLSMSKWKWIILILLYVISLSLFWNQGTITHVDGLPIFYMGEFFFSFIVISIATIIIVSFGTIKYFKFVKTSTESIFGKSNKNYYYSVLITIFTSIYLAGLFMRLHFGVTWLIIYLIDVVFLISVVVCMYSTISYGFGESIQCYIHLEAVFIAHYSGKLIFSKNFVEGEGFNDQLISAFFTAVNHMTSEIRVKGNNLERIVLEDESDIIICIGKYTKGIVIAKKFNKLFKDKLDQLVDRIEREEEEIVKNWIGSKEIYKKIDKMLEEIF